MQSLPADQSKHSDVMETLAEAYNQEQGETFANTVIVCEQV